MIKIILLSITCLFANQMQVEGNLDVTGIIESQTISQLQGYINELEQRINNLENYANQQNSYVSSRHYTLTFENGTIIDLENLTGQLLDWYVIDIVKVSSIYDWNVLHLYSIGHSYATVRGDFSSDEAYYSSADNHPLLVTSDYKLLEIQTAPGNLTGDVTLMITGPFQQTPTNLRKNSNKDSK